MKDKSLNYLSYLLRLWGASKGAGFTWRASLENPMTGERHGFGSLKEMFAFLQTQADAQTHQPPTTGQDTEPVGEKYDPTEMPGD